MTEPSRPNSHTSLVLLEVFQVANRLRLTERKVYRLIKSGQLPAIRIGRVLRIDPADLLAFMNANRVSR